MLQYMIIIMIMIYKYSYIQFIFYSKTFPNHLGQFGQILVFYFNVGTFLLFRCRIVEKSINNGHFYIYILK